MARTFEDLKAEIKVEQAKEYQKAYYQENKVRVIRNCVNPELGLHIFREAFKTKDL